MSTKAIKLEAFDPGQIEDEEEIEALYAARYQQGFEDGIKATSEARERSDQVALEEIAQTFSDLSITLEEAKQSVLASLSPLFDGICNTLLPEITSLALKEQLQSIIDKAQSETALGSLSIAICPEEFSVIIAHFAGENDSLAVCADTDLSRGQARIRVGDCETLLDLCDATRCIQDATGLLADPEQKVKANG